MPWPVGGRRGRSGFDRQMAKSNSIFSTNCATSFVYRVRLLRPGLQADVSRMCQEYAERRQYFVQALNEIPCITCRARNCVLCFAADRLSRYGFLALSEYLLKEGHVAAARAMPSAGALKCIRMPFWRP